jgi:CRISPR-associated protein Cas2
MWLMVTFDLPVATKQNKRDYRRFVDFLEDDGYSRLQYSIYVRPTATLENTDVHAKRVADNIPPLGEVRVFRLTDKQWARTDCYHHAKLGKPELPPEQFTFFDEADEVIPYPPVAVDGLDLIDLEVPISMVAETRMPYPAHGISKTVKRSKKKAAPDRQAQLFSD